MGCVCPFPPLAWWSHTRSFSTRSTSAGFAFCLKTCPFVLSSCDFQAKKTKNQPTPNSQHFSPSRSPRDFSCCFRQAIAKVRGGAGPLLMSYTRFLCASRNRWDAVLRFMQTLLSRIVVGNLSNLGACLLTFVPLVDHLH